MAAMKVVQVLLLVAAVLVSVYSIPVPSLADPDLDCGGCIFAVNHFRARLFGSDYQLNSSLVEDAQYCTCLYAARLYQKQCSALMGSVAQSDTDSYYNAWSDDRTVCEAMGHCNSSASSSPPTTAKTKEEGDNGYTFCEYCPSIASYLKTNVEYPTEREQQGISKVCYDSYATPRRRSNCRDDCAHYCGDRPGEAVRRFLDGLCPYLRC
uniref:Uncharacterized protein n=1 Tax=Palpitomonas bilix TaxID=652834 RepID=A0A7S3G425_9EUKA|mmetsp:Transcript_17369/g.43269  ORF Transcript_17369/g.43269 Transcript_17369/m.43269 type:complete len:209 (+) Transcript_17369:136-762(+)